MASPTREWNAVAVEAYECIAPHFGRSETRARAWRYLQGLLSATERKNGWQLAEQSGEAHPRGIQRLLDEAAWDVDAVCDALRQYVVDQLGEPGGVLIVDETGFLKKGKQGSNGVDYHATAGTIRIDMTVRGR